MSHETRTGAFVYDGSPAKFHEWEFMTMVKWQSTDEERRLQSLSTIIDGLRGEAARIAMDIGHEALLRGDGSGVKKLVEDIRKYVFPQATEAKELYQLGHKKNGTMSRQASEPMVSYVSRRKRWWTQLQLLDKSIGLSDQLRGPAQDPTAGAAWAIQ